jgi:hypothetical protein
MPKPLPEILDFPFFSLEYSEGCFERRIPPDAEDLGGGLFRQKGKIFGLPPGGEALAEKIIQGRPLLSLFNRGHNPLVARGPRLAEGDERLMELCAVEGRAGAGPLVFELQRAEGEWLPLAGLPRHRLFQNVIHEIIDDETLGALAAEFGRGAEGRERFILSGEDIPRFADTRGRLIFQFGGAKLKTALAEDSVFIRREGLSLVLGAIREKGGPCAIPLLRCGERRYPAEEVSRRMDREYILLENQWARRTDIMASGIFPLGAYAGGTIVEKTRLKPAELLLRGGSRFAGLWSGIEADTSRWLESGGRREVFRSHLEFLRYWGISGGVTLNGHQEQAACLVSYLAELAAPGGSAMLVLMEKRYYELYLPRLIPRLKEAGIGLPGAEQGNAPLCIRFYEELPPGPAEQKKTFALLMLVEPEEILQQGETCAHLRKIKAETVLGIFSDSGEALRGTAAGKTRNLFGITEAEMTPFLIRECSRPLALPRFEFPPPLVLCPASGQNLFTFEPIEKFAALSGPSLYSELVLFNTEGPPAPFVPLRLLKGSLDIERMDIDERAFFLFWRGEFRKGNMQKTAEGYIRIYARELCLFSGGVSVMDNFRELLRLWEQYRPVFENLDSFLPRWLADFAVMYEVTATAFPLLVPHAPQCGSQVLGDIYIGSHFIDENNTIAFNDIRLLIPDIINESVFFRDGNFESSRPAEDFETAINAIDRWLRETFHLKLFEFFYPQTYETEEREAFAGMERAGRSSYTVTGLRFSKHPPLLAFLGNLFRYTEHCFKIKNGLDLKGKTPFFGEPWKGITDIALGLAAEGTALEKPAAAVPLLPLLPQITLRESRLAALRDDSDAVRELLKIEDSGAVSKKAPVSPLPVRRTPDIKSVQKIPIKNFVKSLDKTGREALKIIVFGGGKAELADFTKKQRTLPEPLIDAINAAFLEFSGDLLIETVDEEPIIQSEYIEEIENILGQQ